MQVVSFKQRVISSSLWMFGGSAMTQLIRFFSNLVMTRLLAPEMFGLMAVAGIFIMGLNLLSDIGLRQIIIQNKRSDDAFINTIWTIQVIRGWILWLLSIVVAGLFLLLKHYGFWSLTSVYAEPIFPYIIAVIGFNMVIMGYESTKLMLASRNLTLKVTVSIALASQILGIAAMLLWANFYPSVWALVAGSLVSTFLQVVFSYLVIPGKGNHFCLDRDVLKEIVHFGKWIFISSIFGFLSMSSDRLLLGGLVDAKLLGYYAIAGLIVGALGQLAASVIHSVGFPALSETYRENPQGLKSVYYKLRLPFDVALLFSSGFLFVTGSVIVDILYDHRYESVGWILQIMSISLFDLRYKLSSECFLAMGKSKLQASLTFVSIVFLYVFGIFAFKLYGFNGLIWVVACTGLSTIPLNLYYLNKFKLLDWKKELIVLPMLIVGYFSGHAFNSVAQWVLH